MFCFLINSPTSSLDIIWETFASFLSRRGNCKWINTAVITPPDLWHSYFLCNLVRWNEFKKFGENEVKKLLSISFSMRIFWEALLNFQTSDWKILLTFYLMWIYTVSCQEAKKIGHLCQNRGFLASVGSDLERFYWFIATQSCFKVYQLLDAQIFFNFHP